MRKNNIQILAICVVIQVLLTVGVVISCVVGNRQIVDVTNRFGQAVIALPNGEVVEGLVQSWTDFEDGDQIQVRVNDRTYLTHSSNVVLIAN